MRGKVYEYWSLLAKLSPLLFWQTSVQSPIMGILFIYMIYWWISCYCDEINTDNVQFGNNKQINQLIVNTGAPGTELPPTFLNFLFTYLFLIKIYFFIISSLFPQFNLFVLVL